MTTADHDDAIPGLAQAFLRQSLNAAKNRVRAQKAAQAGDRASALAFSALADAQDVHARKALMFLRGRIGDTAGNRAEALLETRELSADMLGWTAAASSDKGSAALLVQMARTLESHRHLADRKEPGTFSVCAICGHIHVGGEGEEPGRCPVCQAVPEKFQRVEL